MITTRNGSIGNEPLKDNLIIGGKFLLLALAGMLVIATPNAIAKVLKFWMISLTAITSDRLIKLASLPVEVSQSQVARDWLITFPQQTLIISIDCTAIHLMIFFAAFVLAYPSGYKSKLLGLTTGIITIFIANIIRLLIMVLVAAYHPSILASVHDYAWQVLFVILVILLWLVWIEKVVNRERKAPVHS